MSMEPPATAAVVVTTPASPPPTPQEESVAESAAQVAAAAAQVAQAAALEDAQELARAEDMMRGALRAELAPIREVVDRCQEILEEDLEDAETALEPESDTAPDAGAVIVVPEPPAPVMPGPTEEEKEEAPPSLLERMFLGKRGRVPSS